MPLIRYLVERRPLLSVVALLILGYAFFFWGVVSAEAGMAQKANEHKFELEDQRYSALSNANQNGMPQEAYVAMLDHYDQMINEEELNADLHWKKCEELRNHWRVLVQVGWLTWLFSAAVWVLSRSQRESLPIILLGLLLSASLFLLQGIRF